MNVGVARMPHSLARLCPNPTPMSIFANPAPPAPPVLTPFSSDNRSNTGSIILHGAHVWSVKNATAARWLRRNELNAGGLVITWIGAVRVWVAEAAGVVEAWALEATFCRSDAANWESGDG